MTFDPRPVRHAYEAIADEYATKFADEITDNAFDRAVIDDAIVAVDPDPLVVDLGCGPGQVAAYLGTRGTRTVGVDLTPAMLAIARDRQATTSLVCGDVLALPFRRGFADGVIAWYSLHNLPRAALPAALSEIHAILRPGGVLVVGTHAGSGEDTVAQDWMGATESVTIAYYEPDELAGVLTQSGFRPSTVRQRAPMRHEHQVAKISLVAFRDSGE